MSTGKGSDAAAQIEKALDRSGYAFHTSSG